MPTEPHGPDERPPGNVARGRPPAAARTDVPAPGEAGEMAEGDEPPPAGVAAMAKVRWALLAGVAALAALSFWFLLAPPPAGDAKYTCPMIEHAFVIADRPGQCPLCGMALVAIAPAAAEARKSARGAASAGAAAASAGAPAGLVPITLHLDRAQKIGVRTAIATEGEARGGVRAPAYVEAPEQGQSRVHVRAPGFVERVAVGQTGVAVGAGQPLVYVYSPEIYRAQEELLAARNLARGALAGSPAGGPTVEAARRRLELFGLTAADVDEILRQGAPTRAVPVRAPAGGYVVRKDVTLGAYVSPETALYEIVDLSRVYVVADVFTRDAGRIARGAVGRLRFPGAGELEAKVDLVYPQINAEARTTRVRLTVPSKNLALRPGLYGEVQFEGGARRALFVPRDALVDTGRARYVFLDEGGGRFSPRAVAVGAEETDRVEIVEGLAPGDRVVSGATFLLDAESRLQASLAGVEPPPADPGHAGHAHGGASGAPSEPSAPSAAPSAPPAAPRPEAAPPAGGAAYWCPMHPEVVADAPGLCPKCNMRLEPRPPGGASP